MSRLAAEIGKILFPEGERTPVTGSYDLVDEDGNGQDIFAPVFLQKDEKFPEVPQDGLFYSIPADQLAPDFCVTPTD